MAIDDRGIDIEVGLPAGDRSGVDLLKQAETQTRALEIGFRNLDARMRQTVLELERLHARGVSLGGLGKDDAKRYDDVNQRIDRQNSLLQRRLQLETDAGARARLTAQAEGLQAWRTAYGSSGAVAGGGGGGGSRIPPWYMRPVQGLLQGEEPEQSERWKRWQTSPVGRASRTAGNVLGGGLGLVGLYQGVSLLAQAMTAYEQAEMGISRVGLRAGGHYDKLRDQVRVLRSEYKFLASDTIAAQEAMLGAGGGTNVGGAAAFAREFGADFAGTARAMGTIRVNLAGGRRGGLAYSADIGARVRQLQSQAAALRGLAAGPTGAAPVWGHGDFTASPVDPMGPPSPADAASNNALAVSRLAKAADLERTVQGLARLGVPVADATAFLAFQRSGIGHQNAGAYLGGVAGVAAHYRRLGTLHTGEAIGGLAAFGALGPSFTGEAGASLFGQMVQASPTAGGDLGYILRARALRGLQGTVPVHLSDGRTIAADPRNPLQLGLAMRQGIGGDRGMEILRSYIGESRRYGGEMVQARVLSSMLGISEENALTLLGPKAADALSGSNIERLTKLTGVELPEFRKFMGTPGGHLVGQQADLQEGLAKFGEGLSGLRQNVVDATARLGSAASRSGLVGAMAEFVHILSDPNMQGIVSMLTASRALTAQTPEGMAAALSAFGLSRIVAAFGGNGNHPAPAPSSH